MPRGGLILPSASSEPVLVYSTRYVTTSDKKEVSGFPGGAVVENLPANAGDAGSSPGLGRSHMPRSN